MAGDIKRFEIERFVIRSLARRELYGYEVAKEVAKMGIDARPNYVYMILSKMEREGLLSGRWAAGQSGRPDRHFYSLSEGGRKELRRMMWNAIDLLNDAFIGTVASVPDRFSDLLSAVGSPSPRGRMIVAMPDGDPATAFRLFLHQWSGVLPGTAMYVVKPPELKFSEPPRNVTVLDGRRHDMPFKDGFGDYLILFGLPADATEEDTVEECARVLNREGRLVIKHPNTLTTDRMPSSISGYEYFGKIIYEVYDNDRVVSVGALLRLLRGRFGSVRDAVLGGSSYLYAEGKKRAVSGSLQTRSRGRRSTGISSP